MPSGWDREKGSGSLTHLGLVPPTIFAGLRDDLDPLGVVVAATMTAPVVTAAATVGCIAAGTLTLSLHHTSTGQRR
jgi:hypothetical protein